MSSQVRCVFASGEDWDGQSHTPPPLSSVTIAGVEYRCEKELGRGNFSVVYLAHPVASAHQGRPQQAPSVAIRLTRCECERRLLREMDILGQFRGGPTGSRIVQLIDGGVVHFPASNSSNSAAGGRIHWAVMAMELLHAQTLFDLLDHVGGALTLLDRYTLCLDVARCVAELQAAAPAVIHRDLKLANFSFGVPLLEQKQQQHQRRPCPKLFDFGLALRDGVDRLDAKELAAGTPTFMAPEAARNVLAPHSERVPLTPASDVWSLGVIFFSIFAMSSPYAAVSASAAAAGGAATATKQEATLRLLTAVERGDWRWPRGLNVEGLLSPTSSAAASAVKDQSKRGAHGDASGTGDDAALAASPASNQHHHHRYTGLTVPAAARELVSSALAYDPAQRATPRELCVRLESLVDAERAATAAAGPAGYSRAVELFIRGAAGPASGAVGDDATPASPPSSLLAGAIRSAAQQQQQQRKQQLSQTEEAVAEEAPRALSKDAARKLAASETAARRKMGAEQDKEWELLEWLAGAQHAHATCSHRFRRYQLKPDDASGGIICDGCNVKYDPPARGAQGQVFMRCGAGCGMDVCLPCHERHAARRTCPGCARSFAFLAQLEAHTCAGQRRDRSGAGKQSSVPAIVGAARAAAVGEDDHGVDDSATVAAKGRVSDQSDAGSERRSVMRSAAVAAAAGDCDDADNSAQQQHQQQLEEPDAEAELMRAAMAAARDSASPPVAGAFVVRARHVVGRGDVPPCFLYVMQPGRLGALFASPQIGLHSCILAQAESCVYIIRKQQQQQHCSPVEFTVHRRTLASIRNSSSSSSQGAAGSDPVAAAVEILSRLAVEEASLAKQKRAPQLVSLATTLTVDSGKYLRGAGSTARADDDDSNSRGAAEPVPLWQHELFSPAAAEAAASSPIEFVREVSFNAELNCTVLELSGGRRQMLSQAIPNRFELRQYNSTTTTVICPPLGLERPLDAAVSAAASSSSPSLAQAMKKAATVLGFVRNHATHG